MVIAFTGHRNRKAAPENFERLWEEFGTPAGQALHGELIVIHGGAEGFDSQVDTFFREKGWDAGFDPVVLRPNYDWYRRDPRVAISARYAPLARNAQMVKLAKAAGGFLVALYDGRPHGGTVQTLQEAHRAHLRVVVWEPQP